MAKIKVITEEMIEAALSLLEKRIAEPPPAALKTYSRRDAFLKLKSRAKEALAAGHTLETVLDDLKGIGIGLTISTARQYLKPGRALRKQTPILAVPDPRIARPHKDKFQEHGSSKPKGAFTVIEDEKKI